MTRASFTLAMSTMVLCAVLATLGYGAWRGAGMFTLFIPTAICVPAALTYALAVAPTLCVWSLRSESYRPHTQRVVKVTLVINAITVAATLAIFSIEWNASVYVHFYGG